MAGPIQPNFIGVMRDPLLQLNVIQNCSFADYANVRLVVRNFQLSQQMIWRIFSDRCKEIVPYQRAVLATPTTPGTPAIPQHICNQDPNVHGGGYVLVKKCQGAMIYHAGTVDPPVQKPQGDWPAPTVVRPHASHITPNVRPKAYPCQNCVNRNVLELGRQLERQMARYYRVNHCKKHNAHWKGFRVAHPPLVLHQCVCFNILRARWNCRDCRIGPSAMLSGRARKWKTELLKTHRRVAKGRNRTLATFTNNTFRRKPVCPVEGCGRQPQTKEDDPLLIKTCLGCCGVILANRRRVG